MGNQFCNRNGDLPQGMEDCQGGANPEGLYSQHSSQSEAGIAIAHAREATRILAQ